MRHLTMILGIMTVFFLSAFMPSVQNIKSSDPISDEEKAGLVKMREEEKLAFEVYTFLDEKWNLQVFNNIKQSESRHGELVKGLLDQYNIKDPYIKTKGKYANADLQKLYTELTTKGSQSLKDAFTVGAIIEDMDIADLDKLMAGTTNKDLLNVYENLNLGSRNHMRAFSRQLEMAKGSYTPTYLTQERYENVINGDHETGNCFSDNSRCNTKGNKGCGNKNGKACAGNGGNKSCGGGNSNACAGAKGKQKGCCK